VAAAFRLIRMGFLNKDTSISVRTVPSFKRQAIDALLLLRQKSIQYQYRSLTARCTIESSQTTRAKQQLTDTIMSPKLQAAQNESFKVQAKNREKAIRQTPCNEEYMKQATD
jgi:hypothetical protein